MPNFWTTRYMRGTSMLVTVSPLFAGRRGATVTFSGAAVWRTSRHFSARGAGPVIYTVLVRTDTVSADNASRLQL